jgi:hypothetical protein
MDRSEPEAIVRCVRRPLPAAASGIAFRRGTVLGTAA